MKYWITASGEKLAVRRMTTTHIRNCINMLERNKPEFSNEIDAALEHGYMLTANIMVDEDDKWQKAIDSFKKELKRRGEVIT